VTSTALFFDIFGRDKGVGDMLDRTAGKGQATGSKLADGFRTAALPAAGVVAGIGAIGLQFGQMAAEAEQTVGAVGTVFGTAASKVEDYAARSANAVGLSSSQYNELSAITGTALKAAGVSVDQLAEKNDALISRGADLASVFGGTTAESVRAMGSAFRGEFDPLERYGLTLTMAQVNAELAARGQDKLGGAALESAKKQAILDLIMQQSASSAGNFARESDTASGSQERSAAAYADAGAKLGEVLLPAMTAFAQTAAQMAQWVSENSGLVTGLAIGVGALAGTVLVVNGAMSAYAAISAIVKGATVAWTGVQWLLNTALMANPIGIVILIIAALVAGVVIAYNRFSWFRDGVDTAFRVIQAVVANVVGFFTGTVVPGFQRGLQWIGDAVNNGRRIFDDFRSGVVSAVGGAIDFVAGLPGRISGIFAGALGWLGQAGRNIIDGFLGGLRASWGGVTDFIGGIGQWIADNKGPESYDRALLNPAGGWIMGGLVNGLRRGMPQLRGMLGEVTQTMQNGISTPDFAFSGSVRALNDGAPTAREQAQAQKTDELIAAIRDLRAASAGDRPVKLVVGDREFTAFLREETVGATARGLEGRRR